MSIDSWANFLMNEKLDPTYLNMKDTLKLVDLSVEMSKTRSPKISMHKHKLESRRFVCETAMDLGIDLTSIKNKRGKMAMGRGLLDMWNIVYKERYGSIVGTASALEAKRRDIKTELDKL